MQKKGPPEETFGDMEEFGILLFASDLALLAGHAGGLANVQDDTRRGPGIGQPAAPGASAEKFAAHAQ